MKVGRAQTKKLKRAAEVEEELEAAAAAERERKKLEDAQDAKRRGDIRRGMEMSSR
jgi:hypothetical protein